MGRFSTNPTTVPQVGANQAQQSTQGGRFSVKNDNIVNAIKNPQTGEAALSTTFNSSKELLNSMSGFWDKLKSYTVEPAATVGKSVFNLLTSSEQALGKTYGGALAASGKDFADVGAPILDSFSKGDKKDVSKAIESQDKLNEMNIELARQIGENKKIGKDTSRLENQLSSNLENSGMTMEDLIPEMRKSKKQIAGETLGVIADILSAGSYSKAATGAKNFEYLKGAEKLSEEAIKGTVKGLSTSGKAFLTGAAKEGLKSAATGTAFGLSQAMQEDKELSDIIKSGVINGLESGVIGSLLGGLQYRKSFKAMNGQMREEAINQYRKGIEVGKQKYEEMQNKIIPELLDKKQWGTFNGLMAKANKGIDLSTEEYAKLGELQGMVNIGGLSENIDDAARGFLTSRGKELLDNGTSLKSIVNSKKSSLIVSGRETSLSELMKLKENIAGVEELNKIKGKGFDIIEKTGTAKQQNLRELAQSYGDMLYDTRKAQQTIEDNKTLSMVKKVDASIRDLLAKENPTYAEINKIYSLNNNLKDILLESEKFQDKGVGGIAKLIKKYAGLGAAVAGATTLSHGSPQSIIGSAALIGLSTMLESTWWNTLRAVQKNELANKLITMSPETSAKYINLMVNQGVKVVNELLSSNNE